MNNSTSVSSARPWTGSSNNKRRRIFDWLSHPELESITSFQRFILDIDWNTSPLGPINAWPAQLRQMVLLVIQDPSPAVIYWGDEATIVYNEAYTELIGQKHPALQGQDPRTGFAEIWIHFEKLLTEQRETAETVVEANAFLLLYRHGFLEETYFSWKFVPIIGSEGWVVGSHATVVEVTREVIGDRRLRHVHALSREVSLSRTIKELWARLIRGIKDAEKDIPIALLYSIADSATTSSLAPSKPEASTVTGSPSPSICVLEGAVGIPTGNELAPQVIDVELSDSCLGIALKEAQLEMGPVVVPVKERTQKQFKLLEWRGFGVPSTHLGVFPIITNDSNSLLAFLVVGLNPRRPFDEDYRSFLVSLTQQVTTPQLSAVILREEVERRQSLARQEALDRDRLSRELSEAETKFAKFANRAPIGLAVLSPDGFAQSANELWRELTQLQVSSMRVSWNDVLAEGELEPVNAGWEKMLTEKQPVTVQTRIKRPWKAPEPDPEGNVWADTYIMLSMYPDFDGNGEVTSVMSCVTDIRQWSENLLRRKMLQAIELKEQTERHIDLTSHEMRNPLSALVGCADEILASLNEVRRNLKGQDATRAEKTLNLIDEAMEAADTIIYCAMHQKRIIDDILTLSRLDSNLLRISPEPSQPLVLVRGVLKMFEAELKRAAIVLDFVEEDSLTGLAVEWVLLDSSRVLQVLINLMTNAIKFTRTESEERRIVIRMGASMVKPSETNPIKVQYVTKSNASPDQTMRVEWGTGEVLYLCITVQDTGRGLDEGEIKNLFHLFTQASPKTYQTYGGSGLGLFISRQLVEMQGGEIGVAAKKGHGSTFQFYVKTRRAPAGNQADLPILLREDALREACAVETSGLNGKMSSMQAEASVLPASDKAPAVYHILVVEDNLVNQKVVMKQLCKAGHIVNVANHGAEALEFIKKSEFCKHTDSGLAQKLNVVLMDLEMPVMDGITAVKKISQLQAEGTIVRHLPVIAVTANARKDQISLSLDAGMDDVITKPYRLTDMLEHIDTLLFKEPVRRGSK
ncbi:related to sensory transduction histidine kinase [Rhynchosporium secalis]|uniref:histidine kinase n=1 Tax=Rhynchosporium secalis TaxID=38038 RepID=A0A1E1MVD1_RHYSE|nr:related to sensory transduction histidine kinase [Rhynchosporium secalis]